MADREQLSQMIDSLIDSKPEEAQVAFHHYLSDKMKDELNQPGNGDDVTA